MSSRAAILAQIEQIAREQNRSLVPLLDETPLLSTGLDSLCFAILVARLEESLGVDPFSVAADGNFPVTVGDFVRFYDDALR